MQVVNIYFSLVYVFLIFSKYENSGMEVTIREEQRKIGVVNGDRVRNGGEYFKINGKEKMRLSPP